MATTIKGSISSKKTIGGSVGASPVTLNGSVEKAETTIVKELEFNNRFEFPNIGKSDITYIAIDENKVYRFDAQTSTYKCIGSDYNEVEVIQCKLKEE